MEWFKRRVLKRVKQKYPIEIYVRGRLVIAGSGKIKMDSTSKYEAIIGIERHTL